MKKVVRQVGKWMCLAAVWGLSGNSLYAQQFAMIKTDPSPVQGNNGQSSWSLKQMISELESRFDVHIIYNIKAVEDKQVSKDFAPEAGIEKTLNKLLEPHQLRYEKLKDGVFVIVMPKEDTRASGQGTTDADQATASMQSLLGKIAYRFDNISSATAEQTVSGRVTSADDNTALPGVSVVVKGSTTGTVTDGEGKYRITVPGPESVLVFSFVGYLNEEIPVGTKGTIDVKLVTDIKALSEVVVVGYGTQKKSQLTGAIASVSSKEISELPITNAQQALQGRVPGVDVVSNGNRPGSGVSVRIRGRRSFNAGNEPLYVIDGIPLVGDMNDINPNDIESMEILKDASATAIYGSRGANGVVLITTKRGKAGKTAVSYDGYYGISSSMGKIDMMDGAQFAEYVRESRRTTGKYPEGVSEQADKALFNPVEFESIQLGRWFDYQDMIIRNGHQQSHQLGVQGGSEKTTFALSGNVFNEVGIVPGQDFNRYTFRLNLDHQLTSRIKLGTSTLAVYNIRNEGSEGRAIGEALSNSPLAMPYDENGKLIFVPIPDGQRTNPLNEIVPGAYITENRRYRIFPSVYGEFKVIDGLTYRVNFGPDNQSRRFGRFRGSLTNERKGGDPTAQSASWNTFAYTLENVVNYSKTFNSVHSLNVTGLYSIQKQREDYQFISARGGVESQEFYNIGAAPYVEGYGTYLEEWAILSYMGRVNYGFNDKYLLTLTGRADGSSRFAPGRKWGFFPSVALAWNLTKENFMQGLGFIDNLKLRVSYGLTGNTGIDPYQTQSRIFRTTYAFGNQGAYGYRPGLLPNENLTWEKTASANAGIDFGFFKGRISGSLDVYQQNTTDLLMERQLPTSGGYASILENIGATRNTGIELGLSTVNLDMANGLRWTTDLSFYSNKEEIVELYGGKNNDVGNRWFIGQPLTVFYDYKMAGSWQLDVVDQAKQYQREPGEIKLHDLAGRDADGNLVPGPDGKISETDDRVILGSDIPKWTGGITNRFEFKGVDFSFFIFARQGSMIRSLFHNSYKNLFGLYNKLDVDYCTPSNPTNAYPIPN